MLKKIEITALILTVALFMSCAGWKAMTPVQRAQAIGDYYDRFLTGVETAAPILTATLCPAQSWLITGALSVARLSCKAYQEAVTMWAESLTNEASVKAKETALVSATASLNQIVGAQAGEGTDEWTK